MPTGMLSRWPVTGRRRTHSQLIPSIRMIYHWLAGAVVLFHAAFVVFVIVGGFMALRWHRLVWLHLPAAAWGVLIEYGGWICPLTPLEIMLRARAGVAGYSGGFIDHYILRRLYPSGLTPQIRWTLGTLALLLNIVAYALILRQSQRRHRITGMPNS